MLFRSACCPPNITRTLASLGQYIYFREENQIYVNLYISNETEVKIHDIPFTMKMEGNFPWENSLKFTVEGEKETDAMFAFRVPSYAKNFHVKRNGQEEKIHTDHGYVKIETKVYKDTFEITFDAPPVFVHANPQVRVDCGKTALVKGPLVYCLEETDNGDGLASILVDTNQKPEETYEEELLGGCSVIHLEGKKISSQGWEDDCLYQEKPVTLDNVKLTLVPYCYWGNRKNGEMLVWMREFL